MDSRLIDLLKQDVAKWEEAAKAVAEVLSHLPTDHDRQSWSLRAHEYRKNAKRIRDFLEQVTQARN